MNYKTVIALGVVGFLGYQFIKREAMAGAKTVGQAVNPSNNDNIFARGVDVIVDTLDDGERNGSNSLGTWIHEKVNG